MRLPGMNHLRKSKGITGTIIAAFVVVPFVLFLAFSLYTNNANNLDRTDYTASQNATADKIASNTEAGFKTGANLPQIMAAAAIIGILLTAFGYRALG